MTKRVSTALLLTAASVLAGAGLSADGQPDRPPPLVIGHHGASGYLPEHTLAAYELAIQQGWTSSSPTSSPRRTAR